MRVTERMNNIENERAEIRKYFDAQNLIDDSFERDDSPSGRFRLQTSSYRQTKPDTNWEVTKVEIYDTGSNEMLFNFISNDRFFHAWLATNGIEYLVCAEDLFGGQTVIDLFHGKMASYSPGDDGFIWIEFFLSPDGKTLATFGCFWACPFQIKVYDFCDPMKLPLPEIKEIDLSGTESFAGWLDDKTFQTEGIETEYVKELDSNGDLTVREVGQRPIKKIIRIDE
jgi:hypothetical protein